MYPCSHMSCDFSLILGKMSKFGQIVYVLDLLWTCDNSNLPDFWGVLVSLFFVFNTPKQSLCRGLGTRRVHSWEGGETAVGEQRAEEDHRQHWGLSRNQAPGRGEETAESKPSARCMLETQGGPRAPLRLTIWAVELSLSSRGLGVGGGDHLFMYLWIHLPLTSCKDGAQGTLLSRNPLPPLTPSRRARVSMCAFKWQCFSPNYKMWIRYT